MTCKHDGLHLSAQGSAAGLLQPCLLCAKMVLVTESRRRNSLNFANERKVMHLHHQGLSAPKIRLKVKSLEGKRPSKDLVNTTIKIFLVVASVGASFATDVVAVRLGK